MAIGFAVCTAPDSHILFLQSHPGMVFSYLEGNIPTDEYLGVSLPEDWPSQPPVAFNEWCVNYSNTGLYHWILNGSPALVGGGGAIFQSWHEPSFPSSVLKLDKHNERFALPSNKVGELAALVQRVDVRSVHRAFADWCKSEGKRYDDIDDPACEPFVDEFKVLGSLLFDALQRKHGLIW